MDDHIPTIKKSKRHISYDMDKIDLLPLSKFIATNSDVEIE